MVLCQLAITTVDKMLRLFSENFWMLQQQIKQGATTTRLSWEFLFPLTLVMDAGEKLKEAGVPNLNCIASFPCESICNFL